MPSLQIPYPEPDQITDPAKALSLFIRTAVERHIEDAEVTYRGFLLGKSKADTKPLKILVGCARKVFGEVATLPGTDIQMISRLSKPQFPSRRAQAGLR
ncbi:MAG: hypothetical protein HYS38_01585 [Acidobacteria bacterium]|nr:hypothetical protein [Acidobacteriota bacterium]